MTTVTESDVLAIVDLAEELELTLFISGGWGVDVLVGRQTRTHHDLDVSLPAGHAVRLEADLAEQGFEMVVDWSPGRRAWRHGDGREVDVHPLESDTDGTFRLVTMNGHEYVMPPGSYVTRSFGGRVVRCLSAEKQLEYHQGYEPSETDLHDLRLLAELTSDVRRPTS